MPVALNRGIPDVEVVPVTDQPLTVTRWTRYGKDRLYVSTADGRRVGWPDLQTGATTVELPEFAAVMTVVVSAHPACAGAHAQETPTTAPSSFAAPTPSAAPAVPIEPMATWVDLAANRPGQAAREQADAELAAMRDRTKVGAFLARALDVKTDERAWRVGAKGEASIGAKLDKLTKHGWYVLHAVPVGQGTSDIDHVVIGPGGVYTVNTKNHPGKRVWVGKHAIKVDGFSVPYLRNSRFEASRAQRLLTARVGWPVFVKPVLIFLTGTLVPDVTIKQQPDDVHVLDRVDVPGAFSRAPERLQPHEIDAIHGIARRSTTWRE